MDTNIMSKCEYFVFCCIFLLFTTTDTAEGSNNARQNCVLEPVDSDTAATVDQMIVNGAKVIHIDFSFQNFSGKLIDEDKSNIYKPLSWVRTTGRHGRSLLLLRPQYEIYSLMSLSLGSERIGVTLKQNPPNCLTSTNATVVSEELRIFLLYNFKTPLSGDNVTKGDTIKMTDRICNLNIGSRGVIARFYHICCYKTSHGDTVCQDLDSDRYITILFVCIYLTNFFAVAFSPLLIPSKLYRKKFQTTAYEHWLKEPLTLSIRKTSMESNAENCFSASYFKQMTAFNKTLRELQINVTYMVTIRKIDIVTVMDRLLPSNRVPVGLMESLYSALVQCEVRKKSSIRDCCKSNMLGPIKPCNKTFPWYKPLKRLMHLLMYILVAQVWVIRLLFYYEYEESERLEREDAVNKRHLQLSYTGNLTFYLTPIHIVFLICYSIFLVDLLLFGIVSKHVINTLQLVLRKCLRDMREITKTSSFGWSVQILIHPFTNCGIFGLLFAWLYYIPAIPVVVFTLAFYCLPTVNILVRLLVYFITYLLPYGQNCLTDRCCLKMRDLGKYVHRVFRMDILTSQESIEKPEQISIKNRVLQLLVIFACVLTILSSVLLAMECIVFLIEIMLYTIIGIIINASHTLKYLSLVFLIVFYARDSFNTVNTEYLTFNSFLNNYLVEKMRKKVEKISVLDGEVQKNTAFQLSLEDENVDDDKTVHLVVKDGDLEWKTHRLILFLDKNDTPYITSKFFFAICFLEQAGVPGPLLHSLLRAMQRFLIICVFLFFVVVVILAFGDEYGISATNQMFATLAGGFLPYMLRFVLFKPPEPVTVDPDNLSFISKFKRTIEEYTQFWKIADIRIDTKGAESKERKEDSSLEDEVSDKVTDDNIRLEEINVSTAEDTMEEVDILIYDKFEI